MKILSIQIQEDGYYGFTFDDGQYSIYRSLPRKQVDLMSLGEYLNYEDFVTSQQLQNPHEVFLEYPPRVIELTFEACEEVYKLVNLAN